MKNLLFLLLLLPMVMFSQVSSWRNGGGMGGGRPTPPPMMQNYSGWRNQAPNNGYGNRPPMVRNRPVYVGGMYPYYNGFGYFNMYPYYWYDSFGYRNRGMVRVYEDGKRDTLRISRRRPARVRIGLQVAPEKQFGGWLSIGNDRYLLLDYIQTVQTNSTTYFPNGRLSAVDFPLVSDWVRNTSFYIGAGKKQGNNGIHLSLGFISQTVRFQGKDQIGYITFPKNSNDFLSAKVGWLHEFGQHSSMKIDYDPIRNIGLFGIALNL